MRVIHAPHHGWSRASINKLVPSDEHSSPDVSADVESIELAIQAEKIAFDCRK